MSFGIPDDDGWLAVRDTLEVAGFWRWPADAAHPEPHREGDWYWWLEVRDESQAHRAGAWNHAPEGFDEVRGALFELVEQVLADEPIEDWVEQEMTHRRSSTSLPSRSSG